MQDHSVNEAKQRAMTTLVINLRDVDDQNPMFILESCKESKTCPPQGESPVYKTTVTSGRIEGVLSIRPDRIFAKDQDTLDFPIRYSFASGSPLSYMQHFSIDSRTAAVTQTSAVDSAINKIFNITIKVWMEINSFSFLQ